MADKEQYIWRLSTTTWVFAFVALALLSVTFYSGIKEMIHIWDTREEYGYGYLIPFITVFMVWQKSNVLEKIEFSGSWAGIVVILLGWIIFVLGSLTAFSAAIQYAMLMTICGSMLAIMGWQGFKIVFIPVLFLAFMIPLPGFFLFNLSAQLQLISSTLGVEVIRLFGISVYLEGNVIDLGSFKLQVVEACSGLRYLFPLMSLAFICAYFFNGAFWKRAIIFLSSIPITIFMNSFRIGVIGVLVDSWGESQAEGFLHDFEGWAVFMACLGVILVEIWILAKIGKNKLTFAESFNLEFPISNQDIRVRERRLPSQYLAVGGLLIAAAISSHFLSARSEVQPTRLEFAEFPTTLGDWQGSRNQLDQMSLNFLKLDDYLLVDFVKDGVNPVNLYVAYYASQKAGESAHSPRTCIPGGGWQIRSLNPYIVDGVLMGGNPLRVNRLIIQKGEVKELVYYWFQQRGRIITNEYVAKWYLLRDAVTRNRTDGALVRLVTRVRPDEDPAEADKRLSSFATVVSAPLQKYIPD